MHRMYVIESNGKRRVSDSVSGTGRNEREMTVESGGRRGWKGWI